MSPFKILFCLVFLQCACASRSPEPELVDKLDGIYETYLTGSEGEARKALNQSIAILSSTTNAFGRDNSMWLAYGRLFCLEKKIGNAAEARICYEKAKYWLIINLQGTSMSPQEIVEKVETFTPERCESDILDWDKRASKGKGPRYRQDSP